MHILLIHQAFAAMDEPGGTRHHELARFLVEQGHKVTVITSPISYLTGTSRDGREGAGGRNKIPWVTSQQEGELTILRTYAYPAVHKSFVHRVIGFLSFMVSSFTNALRVRQVDLVWGTSPPIFQGLTAWAVARLKGIPFIFEVRDLWPAFAIQVGVLHNPILIRLSEWLERFLYRHADQMLVNSPGFIPHIQQRGAAEVELVANGADPRMFDPMADGSEVLHEHALEGKFVALYAGAHGMSNDLPVLLEAAGLLCNQPEIAVVLVGDGKEKPVLQRQAQEMGLTNVYFLPPVPKAKMNSVLAAADVGIAILKPVPLYATVYPNKVFDYMAAGRPVVLAIAGVIRQAVEEAGAGICVPPGDPLALANAICNLANDPAACQEMGKNGRRYIEKHFDRRILAEKLETIFKQAVSSRKKMK
jgi:glycosyltransferase involved in cell wall biosynthesis